MSLPKQVFVVEETDNDSPYLSVYRDQELAAGEADFVTVGTYELVSTARLKQEIHVAVEPKRTRKK